MTIELMGLGWTEANLLRNGGDTRPANPISVDDVIDAALLDGWPPA